jgi:hypothetical protein
VPKTLAELLIRCLDKDPAKRPRAAAIVATMRGVLANAPASQLIATRVDPYGDTDKVSAAVQATLMQKAAADAQQSRQQRNLTILLAVAVFTITSAAGLLIYFFLF